ncbi:unnamed protein product [Rodentolepis nana]|uniref:DUF202 domain-containing protein n=1 Tax=Rodentolepis nana TaxID=102285 RepID=A0A0R3TFU8_RODNA|nr:unnamed protein product [Rodentolepis nana]
MDSEDFEEQNNDINFYFRTYVLFIAINFILALLMTGYGIYLLSANDYAEIFSEFAYALVGSGILAIIAFALGLTTWYKTYFTTAYIVRTSNSTTYSTRYIVLLVAVTIAGTVLGSLTIINLDHIEDRPAWP